MDYVLIKNGQIVYDNEVLKKDLLIGNTKILAIADQIERPEPETPVIDAGGKFILPGAIDTSIAFAEVCQIESEVQRRFNNAEIVGGTTTVIETLMPAFSLDSTTEIVNRRQKKFFIVPDFSFHLSLQGWDGLGGKDIDYSYSHEGITSFHMSWPMAEQFSQKKIEEMLQVISFFDLLVVIEMEQPDISGTGYLSMKHKYEEAIADHLKELRRIISKVVDAGCRLCLLNISFEEQLQIIEEYMDSGLVNAQLVFPYNLGDSDKYEVDKNSIFSGFSLVDQLNLIPFDRFWELLKDRHYSIARPPLNLSVEGIVKDSQVNNRPDEFFLLKHFLSAIFTAGVINNKISIQEFVSIVSERHAVLFGLFPKKGVLRVGSDADIVVWDPEFERNVYCNFPKGMMGESSSQKLKGRSEFVFARGNMVYDGENFTDEGCCGRFLYRSPVP
jgi:dihydroorotase-like cyclic amidohydrolase